MTRPDIENIREAYTEWECNLCKCNGCDNTEEIAGFVPDLLAYIAELEMVMKALRQLHDLAAGYPLRDDAP